MSSSSIPTAAPAVKQRVLAVKFWYDGYDPEKAFDIFTAPNVGLEARSTDPTGVQWQPARPGATVQDVREYMLDNHLRIVRTKRLAQRRNGRWEGLYQVEIGRIA